MANVPQPGETFQGEDGTVSTILAQNYDPNYSPTEEELREYAEYIGIDVDREPYLLPIAREGLRCPLPDEWRACQTNDNEVYYFNFVTGQSLWDHPMDEEFKQKVIEERQKRKGGNHNSGSRRQSNHNNNNNNSSNNNSNNNNNSSDEGAPLVDRGRSNSGVPVKSGATKALSEALLGSSSRRSSNLPLSPQGRLGSITGDHVVSPTATFNASTFALPSPTAGTPVVSMKEKEEQIRRRIEEELAPEKRYFVIQLEKQLTEAKTAMESELKELQAKLNTEWEVAKRKLQSGEAAELEGREMEANWKKRIEEERAKVVSLEEEIKEKQELLQTLRTRSSEEIKKTLEEQNQKEVERQREERLSEVEGEMKTLEERLRADLEEYVSNRKSDTARATKEAEEKLQKKIQETEEAQQQLVRKLEKEVEELRKTAKEADSAPPPNSNADDDDEVKRARAAADREIKVLKEKNKLQMDTLKKQYAEKERKLRDSIARSHQKGNPKSDADRDSLTRSTDDTASNQSVPPLTAEEKKKLELEEEKLKKQVEDAKRIFIQQTDSLLAHRRGGTVSSQSMTPLDLNLSPQKESQANKSNQSINSSGLQDGGEEDPLVFARQELKAVDAECVRYFLSLKQVESKHENIIKQIRDEHLKKLDARGKTDVRKLPQYTKEATERKRVWLQRNPAPTQDMPPMDEVPKINSVMGNMPEIELPSEEEKKKMINIKIKELRSQYAEEEQKELAALEKACEEELNALKERYYQSRLKTVQEGIDRHREESIRSVTPPSSPSKGVMPADTFASLSPDPKMVEQRRVMQSTLEKEKEEWGKRRSEMKESIQRVKQILQIPIPMVPPPSAKSARRKTAPSHSRRRTTPSVESISPAKAAAEETALHTRWKEKLATLRKSMEMEIARYESLCKRSADAVSPRRASGETPRGETPDLYKRPPAMSVGSLSDRPPMFPQSGPRSVEGSHHTAAPHLSPPDPRHTPLRQSYHPYPQSTSVNAIVGASPVRSGGPTTTMDSLLTTPFYRFSPIQHPSQYSASNPPPPYPHHTMSLNTSSIPTAELFANGSFLTPYEGLSELPKEYVNPENTHHPIPNNNPNDHTNNVLGRDYALEDRLHHIREALKVRKAKLKEKQAVMEAMRDEWRDDMRECKANHDISSAAKLKSVKEKLEDMARELNKEVLVLKEAAQVLKAEEMRYEAQLLLASAPHGGGEPSAVVDVLQQLLTRADRLERVMRQSWTEMEAEESSRARHRKSTRHLSHSKPTAAAVVADSPTSGGGPRARSGSENRERRPSMKESRKEEEGKRRASRGDRHANSEKRPSVVEEKRNPPPKKNSEAIQKHLKDIGTWLDEQ